jgi:hypothetical protein
VGGGLQLIVTGSGVLLLLLVFPGGLGQLAVRLRQRVLRAVAARRGLVVPSLVADRRIDAVEPDTDLEGPGLEELLVAASSHAGAAASAVEGDDAETARLRTEAADLRARVEQLERLAGGRRR